MSHDLLTVFLISLQFTKLWDKCNYWHSCQWMARLELTEVREAIVFSIASIICIVSILASITLSPPASPPPKKSQKESLHRMIQWPLRHHTFLSPIWFAVPLSALYGSHCRLCPWHMELNSHSPTQCRNHYHISTFSVTALTNRHKFNGTKQ